MKFSLVLAVTLLLGIGTLEVTSSRILGVFPHIGKSHFFVFEALLKALADRGHDVYVISHFPQATPHPHYHDISVEGSITTFPPTEGINFQLMTGPSRLNILAGALMLGELGTETCKVVLEFPTVQKLLHSEEKFDIVLVELFNAECFLGFAHKFRAPHIALSSCNLMPWANDRFGNPDNPSYIPNIMATFSDHLSFVERLENTIWNLLFKVVHHFVYMQPSQKLLIKYFGEDAPPIEELAKNTSLILLNSHYTLNRARPFVPAVIEVGGLHVLPAKRLNQDLDKWINEAKEGVVFFSMGSMLRTDTLPPEKLIALLEAFRELPQRVLWKWEGDTLPGQPDNVRIGKWLPQRDILAHPNVRLFITHCGLLGIIEAVEEGVPMVGCPIYGDQSTNLRALEVAGAAVRLDYMELTKESVLKSIRTALNNASYSENAKRLSRQYLDRPLGPMETAIFWTEYVIRHKGAHHLRSAAVELSWYQYLLIDVFGALLAIVVLAVLFAWFLSKTMCRLWGKNNDKVKKQ